MTEPVTTPDATEVTDSAPETSETQPTDSPETTDDTDDDAGKGNKEAAKWRTKLRAAEAERDELRDQITAQHRAIIDWRSTTAVRGAVDPQLLDAAGIDIAELLNDNGHLDMDLVDQFIDATATRFNVHRTVKPNPQQGQPSATRATAGLVGMFQQDQQTPGR